MSGNTSARKLTSAQQWPNTPKVTTRYTGSTRSKVLHTNYKWTIINFSFIMNDDSIKELTSPFFFTKDNDTEVAKWCIKLKFKQEKVLKDFISIFLHFKTDDEDDEDVTAVRAKFNFGIIDSKGTKHPWGDEKVYHFTDDDYALGYEKFIRRSEAKNYLVNDKLTIVCDISVAGGISELVEEIIPPKPFEYQLPKDLGALLESQLLSDMILAVDGKEFPVHKAILAARSPVFAVMFQHDMKEKANNRVDIDDIDEDVMTELLRFIYTEKVKNLKTLAITLLPAADKYSIQLLKDKCEKEMCSQLSIENAAESLAIADFHSTPDLKEKTVSFITQNAKKVRETSGWKRLEKCHPQLLSTLYGALVASLDSDQ